LKKIRLTDNQVIHIKDSFFHHFQQKDSLWLFGSRINMQIRGGDIDLYVETHYTDSNIVIAKKTSFLAELEIRIGEQKIDIVINLLSANKNLPIYTEARTTGIKLI
jgi:hypothetical protein